ncbi:hypothetical protein PIB30_040103 [Stylosanthes scabra]|uniref:Ribonuclease H1 N-terminal domain-containing protein n=1 Tax=Stylosanthes scabra TaxID=79078 RepID=A0ABU6QEL1_9FABA|nr:hypothetical protein [Stylosanthes scabra]
MDCNKYSHYAVRVGRIPGIYTTWVDCDEQVHGYPSAQFKGFKRLEDAVEYMQKGPDGRRRQASMKSVENLAPQLSKLRVGSSSGTTEHVAGKQKQTATSPVFSAAAESVPETQGLGFVLEEDMELYLVRVRTKLSLGSPLFEKREYYSEAGDKHYRFLVSLVCKE